MEHREELNRIRQRYRPDAEPLLLGAQALWHPFNPVAIFYRQALERSLVALVKQSGLQLPYLKILDFGCGTGIELRYMASLGALPEQLTGIDLMEHRLLQAKSLGPPRLSLAMANGEALPFLPGVFDLLTQFVVFSSIFDPHMRQAAADEMLRVTRPGGYLLWYDLEKVPANAPFLLDIPALKQLFPGCQLVKLLHIHAHRLSSVIRRASFLAEIWDKLPLPRTHLLALLQKPAV